MIGSFTVGDVFYLDDGRKAKVTGIKDIEDDSVDFDNLNFFANGVLVHNKAVQDGVIPGAVIPREVTHSELENMLNEKGALHGDLSKGASRESRSIVAIHGIPDYVPPSIRAKIEEMIELNKLSPEQRDFVFKNLREGKNVFDLDAGDFVEGVIQKMEREVILPEKLNARMYSDLGYSPVPEYYFYRIEKVVGTERIELRGAFLQKRVRGPTLRQLGDRFDVVKSGERSVAEIMQLKRNINAELSRVSPIYNNAVKAERVTIFDLNNADNVMIEFSERCSNKVLTLEEVFSNNGIPLRDINIRVFTPDLGSTIPAVGNAEGGAIMWNLLR